MTSWSQVSDPSPMVEMNTTPLIDVMLVLLIMFIITIPLQSHAVKIDLPQGVHVYPRPDPVKNRVTVTGDGAILWNGAPISRDGLRANLHATQRMRPIPELHLQPEPTARYGLVDEVLAIGKRAGVANMGFVGNEEYRRF